MRARRRRRFDSLPLLNSNAQDLVLDSLEAMPMTRALLGEQGVTFSHMLATTPVCCPSRSGFVTGRYIHNVGVVNNSIPGNCAGLPWQQGPELFNIGWYLQQAGYRTGYAGARIQSSTRPAARQRSSRSERDPTASALASPASTAARRQVPE